MGRVRTVDFGWDCLAVARPGMARAALRELTVLGEFRPSGYRLLLAGRRSVGFEATLDLLDRASREGTLGAATARVVPLEAATFFEGEDVTEALCEVLESEAARLCGKSFFVRARLRGLKGRLEHQAVERALGGFLYQRASQLGAAPRVSFDDPDLAVIVEVLGRRVGFAFLDRRARSLALVHVR